VPPQHVPSSLGPVDFSACPAAERALPAAERALPAAERGKISLDFLACSNLSFDPSSFLTVPFETNPFFLSSLSLSLSPSPLEKKVFNGHYLIKERIGKGSFGQVVRAVDERTGSEVAIKIIKVSFGIVRFGVEFFLFEFGPGPDGAGRANRGRRQRKMQKTLSAKTEC